jgi:brefeldin A-inhibited guanine nucleotide-exchange protein
VLLMAITSVHCEVHEASLLLSVRACFHIHLISKNLINKTTAKAALTQIISATNQRMEMADADHQPGPPIEFDHIVSSTGESTEKIRLEEGASSYDDTAAVTAAPSDVTNDTTDSTAASAAAAVPFSSSSGVPASSAAQEKGGNMVFTTIYHKDAYLLFRALCKLSMKGLSEETQYAHSDAIPLQNKYGL